jgi:hypothetical protein
MGGVFSLVALVISICTSFLLLYSGCCGVREKHCSTSPHGLVEGKEAPYASYDSAGVNKSPRHRVCILRWQPKKLLPRDRRFMNLSHCHQRRNMAAKRIPSTRRRTAYRPPSSRATRSAAQRRMSGRTARTIPPRRHGCAGSWTATSYHCYSHSVRIHNGSMLASELMEYRPTCILRSRQHRQCKDRRHG